MEHQRAITLTLLTTINTVGVGQTMWLYAAFNVAAWIVWRRMPELTGRSLERIEAQLSEGHFRPEDFAKRPDNTESTSAAAAA